MRDWNMVITVQEGGYNGARRVLERFGPVKRTDYFNILLMRMADARQLLELVREESVRDPISVVPLARVMPVLQTFDFQTPAACGPSTN